VSDTCVKDRLARTLIRACGEIVDVSEKDGKASAAIRLDMHGNKLAHQCGFVLLCGCAMGAFYTQAERFEEGCCRRHTHWMPPDTLIPAHRPIRRIQ